MDRVINFFSTSAIAQVVIIYGLVISLGIWLGRIKLFGISLGITWVLFIGLLFSYAGVIVHPEIGEFLKEFGLILFVYSIGLQVGPGFFSSLRKNALADNAIASTVVLAGMLISVLFFYISNFHISILAGVMSGAITNTPGLGAAQTAMKDLHLTAGDPSLINVAYAVTYPFGIFGIIVSLLLLKKILGINLYDERILHRRLSLFRANKPVTIHLNLDNPQFVGSPLRHLFSLLKEPIVVSRMYHNGEIITPTPDTIMAERDVFLIVASRQQARELKFLLGSPSEMNLKNSVASELVSRQVVVTRAEMTRKRLGDIPEVHQHNFTLTRLNRAGIEMVAHGDIFLQLGDVVTVVGTEEGVQQIAKAFGNSLKNLDIPDLAPIFMGIVLGVILGSIPFHLAMPVAVKIGFAGGPLIIALLLSRFGGPLYLTSYTTNSANLMIRELGIALFLASIGLSSGHNLGSAFTSGNGFIWIGMGICITTLPLLVIGLVAHRYFRKTYFEICGLLAGACTDPPALAFATKIARNDIPSVSYATVYPLTIILRIVGAQLLILLFA